jgi:hypothetical protein
MALNLASEFTRVLMPFSGVLKGVLFAIGNRSEQFGACSGAFVPLGGVA